MLEQAGAEPVALLNHNQPCAYLLSPEVYESMLRRLNADLRVAALGHYVIFFRVPEGTLRIERVLHRACNLPLLFGATTKALPHPTQASL